MALSDFQPLTVDVKYKDKVLVTVRGLSLVDCTTLVRNHLPDLEMVYDKFGPTKSLPESGADIEAVLFSLITTIPDTAARMICMAANEPDGMDSVSKMPLPLQIKIMLEIVRLTFEDVGGPLAFAATFRAALNELGISKTIEPTNIN